MYVVCVCSVCTRDVQKVWSLAYKTNSYRFESNVTFLCNVPSYQCTFAISPSNCRFPENKTVVVGPETRPLSPTVALLCPKIVSHGGAFSNDETNSSHWVPDLGYRVDAAVLQIHMRARRHVRLGP